MKKLLPAHFQAALELFNSSEDPIFAVNAQGIVRGSCNPAALKILQRHDKDSLFPDQNHLLLLSGKDEVRGHLNGQAAVWFVRSIPGTSNFLIECSTRIGRLEKAAKTDPLTGWLNKGEFLRALSEQPSNTTGALMMIDVDRFKPFNDQFGHKAGDDLLVLGTTEIEAAIKRVVRTDDSCYRYGGEELAVWLRGLINNREFMKPIVHKRAEAIQAAVGRIRVPDVDHPPVTVSIGIVWLDPGVQAITEYQKADEALYFSKETGRNRITFYEDVPSAWLAKRQRATPPPTPAAHTASPA